jgi:hypothetical protein
MPRYARTVAAPLTVVLSLVATLSLVTVASAQDKPRMGGELVFVDHSSPPT